MIIFNLDGTLADQDDVIESTAKILLTLVDDGNYIQIWSGRSESVREKTINWLEYKLDPTRDWDEYLKMRPIGNMEPDEALKERWLDEYMNLPKMDVVSDSMNDIEMVFDSDPESIKMWQRRGIYVFNCCQHYPNFMPLPLHPVDKEFEEEVLRVANEKFNFHEDGSITEKT